MTSLANQLDEIISRVVLPLEQQQIDIINPVAVADEVDKLIDPDGVSPSLKTYSSVLNIRQLVRQRLKKRHDPTERAKDYVNSETDDLFGDRLQPYYPVKRQDESGEMARVYMRRELMTEFDVEAVCKRMSRAGSALLAHADELRAEFKTRNAG